VGTVFKDTFTGSGPVLARLPDTVGADPWIIGSSADTLKWTVAGGTANSLQTAFSLASSISPDKTFTDATVDIDFVLPSVDAALSALVNFSVYFRSANPTAGVGPSPYFRISIVKSPPSTLTNSWVLAAGSTTAASGTLAWTSGAHNVKIDVVGQQVTVTLDAIVLATYTFPVYHAITELNGILEDGYFAVAASATVNFVATAVLVDTFTVTDFAPVLFWRNFHGQYETV